MHALVQHMLYIQTQAHAAQMSSLSFPMAAILWIAHIWQDLNSKKPIYVLNRLHNVETHI